MIHFIEVESTVTKLPGGWIHNTCNGNTGRETDTALWHDARKWTNWDKFRIRLDFTGYRGDHLLFSTIVASLVLLFITMVYCVGHLHKPGCFCWTKKRLRADPYALFSPFITGNGIKAFWRNPRYEAYYKLQYTLPDYVYKLFRVLWQNNHEWGTFRRRISLVSRDPLSAGTVPLLQDLVYIACCHFFTYLFIF